MGVCGGKWGLWGRLMVVLGGPLLFYVPLNSASDKLGGLASGQGPHLK